MTVNYPKGFYDFSDGVDISNEEINNWIEELISKLERDELNSVGRASGNTYVKVYRDDIAKYRVVVTKNYQELFID